MRSVHSYEIGLYDDYPIASTMMDGMGFGATARLRVGLLEPRRDPPQWAGQVHYVADVLEVEVEDLRVVYERDPTDRDLEVACGTIPPGTCGALRIQVIGVVDGGTRSSSTT